MTCAYTASTGISFVCPRGEEAERERAWTHVAILDEGNVAADKRLGHDVTDGEAVRAA